ncbi:MAG: phosphatidylserine decarboxylase family protein [Crocinitomicaceae bacterium]|nr:phosphatidylserine decarboxylase family protein [Crocinitomicaceae bacterium]|tara:strand:+ start:5871 stop:6527 length:657 start_codon:yes stop_codon:yes gene_type:complete
MTIHKEGTASIVISIFSLFIFNLLIQPFVKPYPSLVIFFWIVSFLLVLIVIQFFRLPSRTVNPDDNIVLSPADGTVVVIEEVEETEYYNDKRIQVSIFMSPLNVHCNWSPISGVTKYVKYHPGKFLLAWNPKSSTDNERTTFVFENSKASVLVRQIAGFLARRICYYPEQDDKIEQGDQIGFIKFGSRVDLLLPLNANINVSLNQKVTGQQTTIATFS